MTGVGGSGHRGLQRVAAFGLLDRSKSETQGLLSRRGGGIRARLGLLHLTRGTGVVQILWILILKGIDSDERKT